MNMSFLRFNPSKKTLQLLVLQNFFILTFGPSFKINSHVEFIFLNKIFPWGGKLPISIITRLLTRAPHGFYEMKNIR